MRKKLFLLSALAIMVAGGIFWSCQKDEIYVQEDVINLKSAVVPDLYDDWQAGNAEFECNQAGNCFDDTYAYKIDDWDEENGMNGSFVYDSTINEIRIINTITISNSDGKTFDWSSEMPVCKVIVKAGTKAYVYNYPVGTTSDISLVAPEGKDISHVTFCFYDDGPGAPPCEWYGETAWSAGNRYVTRGNWATYTPYAGTAKSVKLLAGQTFDAGTVSFSAPVAGKVTITILLNEGFRLEEFEGEVIAEAVKIQGYTTAPTTTPSPGLFTTYKGTSLVIVVNQFNFYGVHVNVEREVCPE